MAGNYPDVPGPRIAYDVNGSAMYNLSGSTPVAMTSADMVTLNDDSNSSWGTGPLTVGLFFPVAMDIGGVCVIAHASPMYTYYSTDTTNGVDGTWTSGPSWATTIYPNVPTASRTNISTVSWTGVKAIKVQLTSGGGAYYSHLYAVHVYGQTSSAVDKLTMWDPVLDQPLGGAALDFGDVPQGNTQTKTFRIKNESASLTASSITIDDQALTDYTPSIPPQYDYSIDGGATYAQTVNIGNLGPGAISPVVTVRKSTPSNAALSLHTLRITATASSWS